MRAEVVLVLLVDVVWEACQGYYEMDYSQNEDTDFYDTYDSDIGTTSLLTTTETESDVPARIRRFKPPDSTSNSEEQASNDFAPITPTLSVNIRVDSYKESRLQRQ
ncbi:uncharacterized protein LOC113508156 [Trichoplusia ni]|uniref:Uncharacterized protein LOC113508156 n=1 Tax=Trichoplusia ni TaxID=7111 RepID=A0A7E5X172_TRINI|nr:uncharacterized protein LOC113508156 [Trichoplusia ni]